MGWLREKYDKAYFLQRDEDGNQLPYGVHGIEHWEKGDLFPRAKAIMDLLNLRDAEILDLGFGRGDAMRYCLQNGAKKAVGVDFAEAAVELAQEALSDYPPEQYELIHDDMLAALQTDKVRGPWDHILMIDSIEHIQRFEVEQILPLIFRILRPGGCFVVHTPFYTEDNDVFAQNGEEVCAAFEHNGKEADADLIDEFEQTHGMHINRYSKESLARHLEAHGFMRWTNYIFLRPRMLRPIWAYRGPIRWPLARFCGYKVG